MRDEHVTVALAAGGSWTASDLARSEKLEGFAPPGACLRGMLQVHLAEGARAERQRR